MTERTVDIDLRHYQEQEASDLRASGWTVEPPEGTRWKFSLCIGADNKGCPVRTPNLRCQFCNRTLRLRRAA